MTSRWERDSTVWIAGTYELELHSPTVGWMQRKQTADGRSWRAASTVLPRWWSFASGRISAPHVLTHSLTIRPGREGYKGSRLGICNLIRISQECPDLGARPQNKGIRRNDSQTAAE